MVSANPFPRRHDDLKWEIVDNEAIVFDRDTGQATYLNETATLVWALCDGTLGPEDMIDLLNQALGGEASVDPGDVRDALDALERAALINPGSHARERTKTS